jgi:hypothetical protein
MVADQTSKMFKRPTIKRALLAPKQFVTEIRPNGTKVSTWVTQQMPTPIIPNGAPGLVGEIVDMIYKGVDAVRRPHKTPWTPPIDYEFVAKHLPEKNREEYVAKCKEWFESHPKPTPPAPLAPMRPELDHQLVLALFQKYPGAVPPLEERIKVYKAAGYPEEYINKSIARHQRLEETSDARQKVLDDIFGKWPSANKSVPKPKGKVIKAVKKRT